MERDASCRRPSDKAGNSYERRWTVLAFKLLEATQGHWRAVNGPHLVGAGAKFEKGKLIERPDQTPDREAGEGVTKVAA